jgi:hypothetical protein
MTQHTKQTLALAAPVVTVTPGAKAARRAPGDTGAG